VASYYASITDEQAALIRNAPVFFVATADPHLAPGPHDIGPVNVSPKGGVPLSILGPNRVAFVDYVGSGNETARHSRAGGPITVMVCAFEAENAAIVRLYGTARITPLADSPLAAQLLPQTTLEAKQPRHVVDIAVESTATSCGYGVPVMTFLRERRVVDRGRRYKEGDAVSQPATALP
jgi:hypothetical protein